MPDSPKPATDRRREPAPSDRELPDASEKTTSVNESVRARTMHPHKGDVGRAGTNEEIYQGSKERELH